MHISMKKRWSLLLAGAIAIAGCAGEKGDVGPRGYTGDPGENGLSSGAIAGTVSVKYADGTTVAVPGAKVSVLPDQGVTATTDADGKYTLASLPVGIYAVTVTGAGISGDQVNGVTVIAGQTATANLIATYSPISVAITAPSQKNGAIGYAQPVELTAAATGGTAPYTYEWSIVRTGAFVPTEVALQNDKTEKVGFTTGKLEEMIPRLPNIDGNHYFNRPERMGVLPFSPEQIKYMTYTLQVTVKDAKGFRQVAKATVPVGNATTGGKFVARNVRVVLNAPAAATYAWTVTGPDGAVTLDDPAIRNPSFVPTKVGTYTAKNGAAQLVFTVGDYAANCRSCHGTGLGYDYPAIVAKWENSAHGNHFFKKFERDAAGKLVPKADAVWTTAMGEWSAWENPTPMTTFQYGLTNGEGAHYGENCVGCHSVGFNKLADNGGLDEVAGYVFRSDLLHDGGDLTKPDFAAWDALSADAKRFAGMQCESCHGPLTGDHMESLKGNAAAYANFDAQSCAVCHDSVGHHDRSMLWSQSGHANRELALDEGKEAGCAKCHTAQGFVAWAKAGFKGTMTVAPGADAEPQTCQTCHDPHSTGLRVDGSQPSVLENGLTVEGFGAGQLCMTCHQGRRGLVDDAHVLTSNRAPHQGTQAEVLMGRNAFFLGSSFYDTMSPHAYAVEGACVGCHMSASGASKGLYKAPATTNHSFTVSTEICAECHGSEKTFENVEHQFEIGMAGINAAGAKKLNALLTAAATYQVLAWNPETDEYLATPVTLAQIPAATAIQFKDVHGQQGVQIVLANPVDLAFPAGTVSTNVVTFQLASLRSADGATALVPAGSNLSKGLWNYFLLEADRSRGAHNPGFTMTVITATKANIGL